MAFFRSRCAVNSDLLAFLKASLRRLQKIPGADIDLKSLTTIQYKSFKAI